MTVATVDLGEDFLGAFDKGANVLAIRARQNVLENVKGLGDHRQCAAGCDGFYSGAQRVRYLSEKANLRRS